MRAVGRRRAAVLLCAALCLRCADDPVRHEAKGGAGELRVLTPTGASTLNPDLRPDEIANVVGRNVFNQLVTLDADGKIIPDLARSWDVSADGVTYTFHLAHGVRWHDGEPFTSADVKWTFEAIPQGEGFGRDVASRIVSIATPDADTVTMKLAEPWAPLLAALGSFGTFVLPRHVLGDNDWRTDEANDRPIGTGPFVFAARDGQGAVTLEANRQYWARGPYLDRVRFIPASEAAEAAIGRGAVDFTMLRVSAGATSRLAESSDVVVRTSPTATRYYLAFNMSRPPFDDVRVRRAVNLSIDRLELVDRALQGYGAPAFGFYTPSVEWAYNAEARVPGGDPKLARAELARAGFTSAAGGTRLTTTITTADVPPFGDIARTVCEQLGAVGIQATLRTVPMAEWIRRATGASTDFDLLMVGGSQGPDPDAIRSRMTAPAIPGYRNASLEQTVAEGARATTIGTRAAAYFRAQAILAEDQPIAPLAEAVQVTVYRRGVTGLPVVEARGLVGGTDFSLVRVSR